MRTFFILLCWDTALPYFAWQPLSLTTLTKSCLWSIILRPWLAYAWYKIWWIIISWTNWIIRQHFEIESNLAECSKINRWFCSVHGNFFLIFPIAPTPCLSCFQGTCTWVCSSPKGVYSASRRRRITGFLCLDCRYTTTMNLILVRWWLRAGAKWFTGSSSQKKFSRKRSWHYWVIKGEGTAVRKVLRDNINHFVSAQTEQL